MSSDATPIQVPGFSPDAPLRIQLTLADLKSYVFSLLRRPRAMLERAALMCLGVLVFAAILAWVFEVDLRTVSSAAFLAGFCLPVVAILIPIKIAVGLTFRRELGRAPYKTQTLYLSAQGVHAASAEIESLIPWNSEMEFVSTRRYFYLVYAPLRAVIIPRRAFASNAESTAWIEALRSIRPDLKMRTGGSLPAGLVVAAMVAFGVLTILALNLFTDWLAD